MKQRIRGVEEEGKRLDRAAEILEKRDKAAADVERLQSPVAKVKRWISADARKEYQRAQDRLQGWEGDARRIGTTSGADLEVQRSRWLQEKARLPELEEKGGVLSRILNLASRALDGFAQEQLRLLERSRPERPRDFGRGR